MTHHLTDFRLILGISVTVARLTLTQLVKVRILYPQFNDDARRSRRASSLRLTGELVYGSGGGAGFISSEIELKKA